MPHASPALEALRSEADRELALAREIVFYPAAWAGDLEQLYVAFHKLSLCRIGAGLGLEHRPLLEELKALRASMTRVADPASTVWDIWGETMAAETPLPAQGWDTAYDSPGFRPFLNPYLLADQRQAKGNALVIAGGGDTHRCNVVEGYPVAELFRRWGYNAFVLQRRVRPYAVEDQWLDVARAIRYIRHHAAEKGIARPETLIACGFSAGGGDILSALARQYGHVTPDAVYPGYRCDAVDAQSADISAAVVVYGLFAEGLDFSANPALPPLFAVAGQRDPYNSRFLPHVAACAQAFPAFSFFLVPGAPHGFGLGTGVRNYIDPCPQAAPWPELARRFVESHLP